MIFLCDWVSKEKAKAQYSTESIPSSPSATHLSISMDICISPSCASVGICELLLLELLLLLLLLWDVMEGLDCSFLVCLGPAEEDEEVDEPPFGREPNLGCPWEPQFLIGLDWSACR